MQDRRNSTVHVLLQGIMNVPACSAPSRNQTSQDLYCWGMQKLLGWGAYLPWIRSHVIQAQYFKV